MRHVPLIEYTAEEVYQNCYAADDGEDRCWPDALFCRLGAGAGFFREDFEGIAHSSGSTPTNVAVVSEVVARGSLSQWKDIVADLRRIPVSSSSSSQRFAS